jgi:glycosyltransferase involved in cell wall biosynthesis
MKPQVSVIIPSFNRRLMLIEAIGSVLSQREVRFELIVVDDGSTDATSAAVGVVLARGLAARGTGRQPAGGGGLCSARLEKMPHYGVGAARNRGAVVARAEFLAFLDSDDLWAPSKLSRQLDFMRSSARYLLTQTEELWMRKGRRVNPGRRHRKRAGDIFVDSLRTCLISPSAVMIRRELFFAFGGFDRRLSACEDYDLWLRILSRHEVGLLDQTLVTRRAGHAGQLSATVPAPDRFRIITLLKLLADARLGRQRHEVVAEVLAQKCRILAAGLARRGKVWPAEIYARAGALAEKNWRFGDLGELSRLARALADCGLAADNFSDCPDRAPAARRCGDTPTLKAPQPSASDVARDEPACGFSTGGRDYPIGTPRHASVQARV